MEDSNMPQNADFRFSFVRVSGNSKTGPIPTTMTNKASCPDSCALKSMGCYAKSGLVNMHWQRLDNQGITLGALCDNIAALPKNQLWRHNVAGDIPSDNHGFIRDDYLLAIVKANKGKKGFTYTHNQVLGNEWNQRVIREANNKGFTVNLSADSLGEADKLLALNIGPVVTLLPENNPGKILRTSSGNTVVVCPAVSTDGITCEKCGLCANGNRKSIVGFPVHGSGRKKAQKVIMMKTKGI